VTFSFKLRRSAGSFSVNGAAGANTLRFQGWLKRRHELKPGKYKLTVTAAASGLNSKPATLRFTIKR
jgi:hypothetical protein